MTCDVSVISVAGLVSLTAMAMPAHAHHEGDFSIGISGGPAPQLRFEFDPDILAGTRTIGLARSVNPAVPGWLGEEPGFEAMETDEPEGGLFALGRGARIRLVGIELGPALFVRAQAIGTPVRIAPTPGPGFLELGDESLHTHAVWHINPSAAGFEAGRAFWAGTFKLVDTGTTGYADSEPFTIRFAPVPEPASGVMLVAGLLLGARFRCTSGRTSCES